MVEAPAGPDGLAVVDKAAGWTSHDVVAKARGVLGTRKVGHSGTLDPDATGVLLLGVGKVTRLLRFLGLPAKTYTGVIVLGTATSTLDASGEVTGTLGHGRRRRSATVRGRGRRRSPATSSRCRRWCRRSRSTGSASTSWPARGSRSSARPARSPSTASRSASRASRAASRSRSRARRAPTSARWPPTSAPRSAGAPTCATCAAPPSARFTVDQARPVEALDARGAAVARPTALRDLDAVAGRRRGGRRRRPRQGARTRPPRRRRRRAVGGAWGRTAPCCRLRGATAGTTRQAIGRARPNPAALVTSAGCRCCTTSGAARGPMRAPSSRSAPTTACTSATRR